MAPTLHESTRAVGTNSGEGTKNICEATNAQEREFQGRDAKDMGNRFHGATAAASHKEHRGEWPCHKERWRGSRTVWLHDPHHGKKRRKKGENPTPCQTHEPHHGMGNDLAQRSTTQVAHKDIFGEEAATATRDVNVEMLETVAEHVGVAHLYAVVHGEWRRATWRNGLRVGATAGGLGPSGATSGASLQLVFDALMFERISG